MTAEIIMLIIALLTLIIGLLALVFGSGAIWKGGGFRKTFVEIRRFLNQHRYELSDQAFHYYHNSGFGRSLQCNVCGESLTVKILTGDKWIPESPLPFDKVKLELLAGNQTDYSEIIKKAMYLWPYKTLLSAPYPNYHEVIDTLDRPTLWENRISFTITDVEVTESLYKLSFYTGKYFEYQDTGEALAYELATIQWRASQSRKHSYLDQAKLKKKLKYREVIGNPDDFSKRCAAVGIDTLTIFNADQEPRFVLHHREAGKVAMAAEMYTAVPAGEFQPAMPRGVVSGSNKWNEITKRDFGMWRNIMREFNEELLGAPEIPYPDDYLTQPPFNQLMEAKEKGDVTPYFLGFALDPMSLKPDILTVCIFKGNSFQKICSRIFQDPKSLINEEGLLYLGQGNMGIPFDGGHIRTYAGNYPMYPTSKALLILAYQHRDALGIKA